MEPAAADTIHQIESAANESTSFGSRHIVSMQTPALPIDYSLG
jgi:hypothetical protein